MSSKRPTRPPSTNKPSSNKRQQQQYPSPFTAAPSTLDPLLPQLNPAQLYILHIDRHPAHFKRRIFIFAVLVNTTIAVLLFWRLFTALPAYYALLQTLLGYVSAATVDTSTTTRGQQIWILARRVGMMLVDYALVAYIVPWPLSFFLERPANPVSWRAGVAFQAQEVVVRMSRGWGSEELLRGKKVGDASPFWKTRVAPAVSMETMKKTGYLMMDASFDLDFATMLDVHTLLSRSELRWRDIDRIVLVHSEGQGWLLHEFGTEGEIVEERRKKMMAFREVLVGKGKESLFWKWQGIVEEERGKEGGFTEGARERIRERVGEAFEREGVDFEEVRGVLGEVEGLPVVDEAETAS